MPSPTPLASLLGGLGLAIPVHTLMLLNGSIFGISGFVHSAIRGNKEAVVASAGLLIGGAIIGLIEGQGPPPQTQGLLLLSFSGFLVGLGTKLSNGCTSGHMLAGLSRFSKRSIAATVTFFGAAVVTTRLLYSQQQTFAPVTSPEWNINSTDKTLLVAQAAPLIVSLLLYTQASASSNNPSPEASKPRAVARLVALLSTTVEFALALRLSNLTDPSKVSAFLLLPFHLAFDPSLAFLAIGAIPLGSVLYHFFRGSEQPVLGGRWAVPKAGKVNMRLLLGAVIFGVGWGVSGFCPGPVLINFGRAVATSSDYSPWLCWLCAFVAGGLCVN